MRGWHKIDLHQHTLHEITYDGKEPQSLYTHDKFEKVIKQECVELKAVTNHNTLNIVDHIKHALIINKNKIQPNKELIFVPSGGVKNISSISSIVGGKNNEIPYIVVDSDKSGSDLQKKLLVIYI